MYRLDALPPAVVGPARLTTGLMCIYEHVYACVYNHVYKLIKWALPIGVGSGPAGPAAAGPILINNMNKGIGKYGYRYTFKTSQQLFLFAILGAYFTTIKLFGQASN